MIRQYCEHPEHRGYHHNVHDITKHPVFSEPRSVCRDCIKEMLKDHSKTVPMFGTYETGLYMSNPYTSRGWIWLSKPKDIPPFC